MAQQTSKPMKGQPEVSATGVHPKSQRGTKQQQGAKLNHTNPHTKRGRNWLRTFVSGVLVTSAAGAEYMLYTAGLSDTATINMMWMVGVTYVAAVGTVYFVPKWG